MNQIKQHIPNREVLREKLDAALKNGMVDFLSSTQAQRQAVLVDRRYALLAGTFSIAILLSLYFIRTALNDLAWKIFLGCAVLWLLIVLVSARRWLVDTKLLAMEVNMALAPIISNVLDRTVIYSYNEDQRDSIAFLLKESSLMTVDDIKVISDDALIVYDDTDLMLRELVVTKPVEGARKSEETVLFKGMFVTARLPFKHGAETYISTENDRNGFAHRTFWSDLIGSTPVKETILEWADFEKKLHVASTDPVTARELLTPDCMQDLYAWWLEHKLNMRIAFKNDRFYMLLPEASIQVGFSTNSTDFSDIRKYVCSLITPLWRSLVLIQDVSDRKV